MENKKMVFADFARKAAEKIEAKKVRRKRTLYLPDFGEKITVRGLSVQEWTEVSELFEKSREQDMYVIYMASRELQELAAVMVENGTLQDTERYRVCDMFGYADIRYIANEIIELSGIMDETNIQVLDEVEETKN